MCPPRPTPARVPTRPRRAAAHRVPPLRASLTHGGAIATILDTALGTCALAVAGTVVTANLSIDYVA